MQGGLGTEAPLAAGLVHRGVYSCLCHDVHPVLLPSKLGSETKCFVCAPIVRVAGSDSWKADWCTFIIIVIAVW